MLTYNTNIWGIINFINIIINSTTTKVGGCGGWVILEKFKEKEEGVYKDFNKDKNF